MFFAAGKISQGKRKFRVADHPQIGLNAPGQDHAGLGLAFGRDAEDAGLRGEKIDDRAGLP